MIEEQRRGYWLAKYVPTSRSASAMNVGAYYLSCLASVCFLVYINASQPFVIRDILGRFDAIGRDVGNLGFADELLSIFLAPIWGAISDKIGTRIVTSTGYVLVGISLMLFVQARNVYPQLLLCRLLFASGASACISMVAAMLPQITTYADDEVGMQAQESKKVNGRLAGIAGFCTGVGALIAVAFLLPLPRQVLRQHEQLSLADAIRICFYIVGSVAIVVGLVLFIGLKRDDRKSIRHLLPRFRRRQLSGTLTNDELEEMLSTRNNVPYYRLIMDGILAGRDNRVALAYAGGFIARADSIVISLFIPTFVLRNINMQGCRESYALTAAITGSSQLTALLTAPLFGYLCDRFERRLVLCIATLSGIIGFTAFGLSPNPRTPFTFLSAILMGFGQVGGIVTSLALSTGPYVDRRIRGSVAGAYSLTGGCGILLLTELGGYLFDRVSPAAPFFIMSAMNAVLFVICSLGWGANLVYKQHQRHHEILDREDDEQEWSERQGLLERVDLR